MIGRLPKVVYEVEPPKTERRVQFFVSADPRYFFDHATYLIRSIDRYAPRNAIHFHIINPTPEVASSLAKLRSSLAATYLSSSVEHFGFGDLPKSFKAPYCASVRFVRIYQFMLRYPRDILSLDADSLVRGPVGAIRTVARDADLVLVTRPGEPRAKWRVATGTVYFKSNLRVLRYLRAVSAVIAEALVKHDARWYLDQETFYNVYESGTTPVRLASLPRTFADWEYAEESVIWAGKGKRKVENEQYAQFLRSLTEDHDVAR